MTKWLVIVAGPNGAGKSTFVSTGIIQKLVTSPESGSFEILNPDAFAVRLAGGGGVTTEANLEAARQVESELAQTIQEGRSIGVETVLSSGKYLPLVETAIGHGYRVLLHYVILARADLHVARVGQRVAQGGHDIPPEKIADRYRRSLEQLPWFAQRATRAFIWDNSYLGVNLGTLPLVAEKHEDGTWSQHDGVGGYSPLVIEAVRRVLAGEA